MDVDLTGWVGVGLGETYGCRCGIFFVGGITLYGVGLSDIFFLSFSLFSLFFGTYRRGVFFGGLLLGFCYVFVFFLANKHHHLAIYL